MTTAASTFAMLPYVKRGEIDYAGLDYNPDEPEPMPDAMEQEFVVNEILGIMHSGSPTSRRARTCSSAATPSFATTRPT